MCNITKFKEKMDELEDYLEFVNTDIDRLMEWEPDLYAAFAAHNDLSISTIKDWYQDAEDDFVSSYSPDLFLYLRYDINNEMEYDRAYEQEVFIDGTLYECAGYWFTKR